MGNEIFQSEKSRKKNRKNEKFSASLKMSEKLDAMNAMR